MLWKGRGESSNVVDNRSLKAGKLGLGGLVVGAIIYTLMGGNPLDFLTQNAGQVTQSGANAPANTAADDEKKQFAAVVLADTEKIWDDQFKQQKLRYDEPKMVLFRGATHSACGSASSQVGPFYCGADQRIYLDLGFFDELSKKLGARGDAAAAYVIAHEVGHHVQNLLGIDQKAQREFGQTNQASVATELQADCFAGVWAGQLEAQTNVLEKGDIEEALGAASAVGDDRLQSQRGGTVSPDSFTHGSSAQRMAAFRQGYEARNMQGCLK